MMGNTPGEVSKATTSEVERLFLQMMITGRSDVVPLPSAVDNMIVTISRTVGAMRDDGVRCELADRFMSAAAFLVASTVDFYSGGASPELGADEAATLESLRKKVDGWNEAANALLLLETEGSVN